VHARTEAAALEAAERVRSAYTVGRRAPEVGSPVRDRIVATVRRSRARG